jgi:hypothetical protein
MVGCCPDNRHVLFCDQYDAMRDACATERTRREAAEELLREWLDPARRVGKRQEVWDRTQAYFAAATKSQVENLDPRGDTPRYPRYAASTSAGSPVDQDGTTTPAAGEVSGEVERLRSDLRDYKWEWESACDRDRQGQETIKQLRAQLAEAEDGKRHLANEWVIAQKEIAGASKRAEAAEAWGREAYHFLSVWWGPGDAKNLAMRAPAAVRGEEGRGG